MRSPRIPQEIVDTILALLDRSSLIACSRVCRSWGHGTRRLLFNHISINEANYSKFLELLSGCTFEECVRVIHLANRHRLIDHGTMSSTPLDDQWLELTLPTLTQSFPKITELTLQRISWDDIRDETQDLLYKGWKKVKTLTMESVHFPRANDSIQFIQSFPLLHTLSWTSNVERRTDDFIIRPLNQSPAVTTVTMDATTAGNPALCTLISQSTSRFIDLEVDQLYGEMHSSFLDLNSFLETVGPKVKSLTYNLWYFDTSDEVTPRASSPKSLIRHLPINVSTFHNLERLTLGDIPTDTFWFLDDDADASPILPSSLIQSIPSTILSEVNLEAALDKVSDDAKWFPWNGIDEALSNSKFSHSLRSVSVEVGRGSGIPVGQIPKVAEAIERSMVWAHAEPRVLKTLVD